MAALLGCVLAAEGAERSCPIPGEPIQWIADFCMASLGTDDEIAASVCINRHLQNNAGEACKVKEYYKRALCKILIANDSVPGPLERCVADPKVRGRTVTTGRLEGGSRQESRPLIIEHAGLRPSGCRSKS